MERGTKIRLAQREQAYRLAQLVRDGRVTVTDAKSTLVEAGFNKNTAGDFIANLSHMLDGTLYQRRLSVEATRDYLSWIRRDYGDEAHRNAQTALLKHIQYWENYSGSKMPAFRRLLSSEAQGPGESEGKLSEIDSKEAILQAMREFDQIGREEFLARYDYGPSRAYFIEFNGKRYDSKAIVGVARKYTGRGLPPLRPSEFSGGESTVKSKLESLGFEVVQSAVNPDWSDAELKDIVSDYLNMLKLELGGQEYNKTKHRELLSPKLDGRSNGSIEFKHANISSALAELGLPYIKGYKPREHAQTAIAVILDEGLKEDRELRAALEAKASATDAPTIAQQVPPPDAVVVAQTGRATRRAVRIDFQKREEQNRLLGLRGEELVVHIEQQRLISAGRPDLAAKVEHVATTQGDGLGYDVLSFDEQSSVPQFVEVKTTTGNIDSPFLITLNEIEFSEENADQYALYRVFEFGAKTKFYVRKGSITSHFALVQKVFLASPLGNGSQNSATKDSPIMQSV